MVNHGLFESRTKWSKDEFRILCQGPDASAVMKRLRPFMLRRTKKMAAPELPSKTFIPLDIPMSDLQSDLYAANFAEQEKLPKVVIL